MKPRIVWMRNDGVVRIVLIPTSKPQLVVEGKGTDALGNENWSYTLADMGGFSNLEAFALALMGHPLSADYGFSGELMK